MLKGLLQVPLWREGHAIRPREVEIRVAQVRYVVDCHCRSGLHGRKEIFEFSNSWLLAGQLDLLSSMVRSSRTLIRIALRCLGLSNLDRADIALSNGFFWNSLGTDGDRES